MHSQKQTQLVKTIFLNLKIFSKPDGNRSPIFNGSILPNTMKQTKRSLFSLVLILHILFGSQSLYALGKDSEFPRQNKQTITGGEGDKTLGLRPNVPLDDRWKRIDTLLNEHLSILKKNPNNIDSISHVALLYVYAEDFKKAHNYFSQLQSKNPKPIHSFYKALTESLTSPLQSLRSWRQYNASPDYATEEQVWRTLAIEIESTVKAGFVRDKKKFKQITLWLFSQKAYYTAMIVSRIYVQYLNPAKKTQEDVDFAQSIHVGALIRLGYLWDAIAYLERIEYENRRLSEDQRRRLGISYYKTKQHKKAIEQLKMIKDEERKNSIYYFYLAVSYLRDGQIRGYQDIINTVRNSNLKEKKELLKRLDDELKKITQGTLTNTEEKKRS